MNKIKPIRNIVLIILVFTVLLLLQCKQEKKTSTASSVMPNSSASVTLVDSDIAFTEISYESPAVLEGENIEHTYTFTNSGSEALKLVNVKAGWGCTVSSYTKEEIQPGGHGEVKITMNTQNRVGAQHKSVTVETNSKKNQNVSLAIKGNVKAIVDVPKAVSFNQIAKKGIFTKEFDFKVNEEAELPVKVLSAKTSIEYLKVSYDVVNESKEYKFKVELDAEKATKMEYDKHAKNKEKNENYKIPEDLVFNGSITVETDQEKKKLVYINVNGTLAKDPKTPEELKSMAEKKENPVEKKQ